MEPKLFVLFSFILILLSVQCHAEMLSFSHYEKTFPFEFVKTLQGSHKGAKVKGIYEIKKYLHRFGYLSDSYKVHQAHGQNDDNFDDILESAIKTYQLNYNLNVTGTLDTETISMMMLPRCGVPDIVNGEAWMRSKESKKRQDHHRGQNKKVLMVSHFEVIPGQPKWGSSTPSITYGFVNNERSASFVSIMKQAFNRWSDAAPRFTFTRDQNPASAGIKIGVFNGDHGDGVIFDGPNGILAHANPPPDSNLHFDGQEKYAGTTPRPYEYHLESLAVHEIGHTLGLAHSSVRDAIMYPILNQGQIKVVITSDDLAGITALYG